MIKPGSKRWKELVAMGILKDADRNWFLGDATLEIVPIGNNHGRTGALDLVRQYAVEVGVDYNSIRTYRDVAAAWPDPTRVGSASWTMHRECMNDKDLIRRFKTVSELRKHRGQETVLDRTGDSVEDKITVVHKHLRDPKIMDRVIESVIAENPRAASIATTALNRKRERFLADIPPVKKQSDDPGKNFTYLITRFHAAQYAMREVVEAVVGKDIPDEVAASLLETTAWLRNAVDLLESGLRRGDVDEALRQMLEAE